MRRLSVIGLFLLTVVATAAGASAQEAAKKPNGPIGDVVSVDTAKGVLTIKTLPGPEAKASVTARTEYLLVEPGKKDFTGAQKGTLADLKVGDRVWARGDSAADGTVAARQVVIMSATAIADRNQKDAQDWMKRGVRGEVKAIDAATGVLTVESYRGETVSVVVGTGTSLRRLKGGPTDLANSDPISLADIQVGDQVATRGDRTADGASLTAESVFAGTFARPVGGRVASIDAAKNEIHVMTRAGKEMTLALEPDALVRKLTPPERRAGEGAGQPGAGAPAGGGAPAAGAGGGPGGPGRPGGPGGPGGRGGFGFGMEDRAELERRTTAITLADVKPGDIVFAVAEPGATDVSAKIKILVKLDIPADRIQRGPGMQGPGMSTGGDPGMDAPPN